MPVANPFTFFGAIDDTDPDFALFTGFPYCPESVNVSTYDYWTSFSGWSKVNEPADDAAKEQSINDSWDIAMALFWNAAEINGLAEETSEGVQVTSTGVTTLEPEDRDCSKIIQQSESDNIGAAIARIGLRLDIKKMYNGSEFVGYGTPRLGSAYAYYEADPEVSIKSWGNDIPDDPFEPTVDDVDYTTLSHPTLGDINLVCAAIILDDFAINPNVDAANRLAEDLFSTARIDDIDFYTYST